MKKFEIRKIEVETKDGKDPFGVFQNLTNRETELIASYDTLEEARKNLVRYTPSVNKEHYCLTYFLHECYIIEENDYDEDGELKAGGVWWNMESKEWEDEEDNE